MTPLPHHTPPSSPTPTPTHLPTSSARLQIPHDQLPLFQQETAAARKQVLDWIAVLEPIRQIERGRVKELNLLARRLGEKPGNVIKRFYAYLAGRDGKCHPMWERLIDRRDHPRPGHHALDARFLDYWKRLYEQKRRVLDGGRQAHRDLLSQLDRWHIAPADLSLRIPGYQQPPVCDHYCSEARRNVPAGWSYRNLIRHKSNRVELLNIIVGPQAASAYLPFNIATRAGVQFRQVIFSDDQEYDNRIVSPLNKGEAMRPQGFNTLDYLTASFQHYGIQLRRRDEDTGRRKGIDQEFYVWTILADLMRNGFRDDDHGTKIVRELGTAKGYNHVHGDHGESFDHILHHITGGRVIVDHSGRFDQGLFAQMFFRGSRRDPGAPTGPKGKAKQSVGNFRYKAPLESAFHRVRTQSAGLIGHTGNRYQIAPEDTAAIDGYTRRLFKAIEKLPPAKRDAVWDLLRHPLHTWDEFSLLATYIYAAVNNRRDHKLEGWGACGFIVPAFRLDNPLDPTHVPIVYTRDQLAAMDDRQRHYVQHMGTACSHVLSPSEADALCRARDRKILRRIGRSLLASALPERWAYPRRHGKDSGGVKVQPNGTLIIRDPLRFGTDALTYLGLLHDEDGHQTPLRPGTEWLVQICPFDPEEALIIGTDGRYRGFLKLLPRPTATDTAARLRQQAGINEYKAAALRDSERRHQPDVDRHAEIVDHNRRILADPDAALAESGRVIDAHAHLVYDDPEIDQFDPPEDDDPPPSQEPQPPTPEDQIAAVFQTLYHPEDNPDTDIIDV